METLLTQGNKLPPKELIIFLEGVDIAQDGAFFDKNCPNLQSIIKAGTSEILLHPKPTSDTRSSMFYLLGFESFSCGELQDQLIKTDQPEIFDNKSEKSEKKESDGGDDEVTEVKYPVNPQTIKEVTLMKLAVHTNSSEVSQLCQKTEINYCHSTKTFDNASQARNSIDALLELAKDVDVLIVHRTAEEKLSVDPLIQCVEQLCDEWTGKIFIKFIASPFGKTAYKEEEILNTHLSSADPALTKTDLKQLVPRQTYQFNRGEAKDELTDQEKTFLLCVNLNKDSKGTRKDKINSFTMLGEKDNLRKLGGGRANIAGLFREITFELGKLPKFGA